MITIPVWVFFTLFFFFCTTIVIVFVAGVNEGEGRASSRVIDSKDTKEQLVRILAVGIYQFDQDSIKKGTYGTPEWQSVKQEMLDILEQVKGRMK